MGIGLQKCFRGDPAAQVHRASLGEHPRDWAGLIERQVVLAVDAGKMGHSFEVLFFLRGGGGKSI